MNDVVSVIGLVVVMGAIAVSVRIGLAGLNRRLDRLSRIEGKLDAVLKHSGIRFDPLDGLPPEALDALKQGRKIDAIKHYRQHTGADLAEAKEIVDEAIRRGRSV
jgi:hypothetical protein